MNQKNEEIEQMVTGYCKRNLDEEYLKICTMVIRDILKKDKSVFERGKPEIWSASIIWAVGSENFLGDKSFEPYATLSDVCEFFNVNTSTVGQKSRKIKDILNISIWNPKYRLSDSEIGNFLDSLVVTPDGIIVPQEMLYDIEPESMDDEVTEEDASPEYYLLIFKPVKKLATALYYQLEYELKKILDKEERLIKSGITDNGKLKFVFFGWWNTVEKIQVYTHAKTEFVISEIYYDDNAEALEEIRV